MPQTLMNFTQDNKMIRYVRYQSYSGDWYRIPAAQYEQDVKSYEEAVSNLDEDVMLYYEEGQTGWEEWAK